MIEPYVVLAAIVCWTVFIPVNAIIALFLLRTQDGPWAMFIGPLYPAFAVWRLVARRMREAAEARNA